MGKIKTAKKAIDVKPKTLKQEQEYIQLFGLEAYRRIMAKFKTK